MSETSNPAAEALIHEFMPFAWCPQMGQTKVLDDAKRANAIRCAMKCNIVTMHELLDYDTLHASDRRKDLQEQYGYLESELQKLTA